MILHCEFVKKAKSLGSEGTSVSLNEAATLMLEWNIEMFQLARKSSLYNTIVTNGYMTTEALDLMIAAGLDAANVDVKGCEEGVREAFLGNYRGQEGASPAEASDQPQRTDRPRPRWARPQRPRHWWRSGSWL